MVRKYSDHNLDHAYIPDQSMPKQCLCQPPRIINHCQHKTVRLSHSLSAYINHHLSARLHITFLSLMFDNLKGMFPLPIDFPVPVLSDLEDFERLYRGSQY